MDTAHPAGHMRVSVVAEVVSFKPGATHRTNRRDLATLLERDLKYKSFAYTCAA
jgi:hypothetical protein